MKRAKKSPSPAQGRARSLSAAPARRVLFLCSGNYYRSRYAEALFNHFARAAGWPWRAFSRGLSTHLVDGDISPHTRQVLLRRGIALRQTAPGRRPLSRADLAAAAHIVALKESEHRPIMRARFPKHAARVEYWKVHDLDASLPAATLAHIEKEVLQLAKRLLRK
ncbi:MAG TPA: low molecular weight phosphatase family protein [Opitutales bacterium]|nr:low molecular weight phosphatase family protein [Opitutales bacterium]